MAIMCLKCFQVYNRESLILKTGLSVYNLCPKIECYGHIVEIDELFVPIIKVLNSKGYHTLYCCSSHIYDNYNDANTYIRFDKDVKLPSVPSGFKSESNGNIIRKFFKKEEKESELILFQEIIKTANDVLLWANELPD